MLENISLPLGLQLFTRGGGDDLDEFKPKDLSKDLNNKPIDNFDNMLLDEILYETDTFINENSSNKIPIANYKERGIYLKNGLEISSEIYNFDVFSILVPGLSNLFRNVNLPIVILFGKDHKKNHYGINKGVNGKNFLKYIDNFAKEYKTNIAVNSDKLINYKTFIYPNLLKDLTYTSVTSFGTLLSSIDFINFENFLELAMIDLLTRIIEKKSITDWVNTILDCVEKKFSIDSLDYMHTILEEIHNLVLATDNNLDIPFIFNLNDLNDFSNFNSVFSKYIRKNIDSDVARDEISMFGNTVHSLAGILNGISIDEYLKKSLIDWSISKKIDEIFDKYRDSLVEFENKEYPIGYRFSEQFTIEIEDDYKRYYISKYSSFIGLIEDTIFLTNFIFNNSGDLKIQYIYSNSSQNSRIIHILTELMYSYYSFIKIDKDENRPNIIKTIKLSINLENLIADVENKKYFYIDEIQTIDNYPMIEPGETNTKGLLVGDMLITKLTGPVSFNLLVPTHSRDSIFYGVEDMNLPIIVLFGDIHFDRLNGCNNCNIGNSCIAINQVEFLNGLDTLSERYPTNVYIEQLIDPRVRNMLSTADDEQIEKHLVEQMKFNLRGDYLTDMFHNNYACFIKELKEKPYYRKYCKSIYPYWHYLDIRNLTTSSEYHKSIFYESIYLGLISYIEEKYEFHYYMQYIYDIALEHYSVDVLTEDQILELFSIMKDSIVSFYSSDSNMLTNLVFNSNYKDYSIVQKQLYKNSKKTIEIWKKYFKKYFDMKLRDLKQERGYTTGININLEYTLELLLDKYYNSFRANGFIDFDNIPDKSEKIFLDEFASNYTIAINSAIADSYFLLRLFKVLPSEEYGSLVIGYFGDAHTNSITEFLTKIAKAYRIDYRIKSKYKKNSDNQYRCLNFNKRLIDLEQIIVNNYKYTSNNNSEIPEELI